MNERQDYFGQTVNIASRVQGLATSQSIFATGAVVDDGKTADLLLSKALTPRSQSVSLRGIEREVPVYAIPGLRRMALLKALVKTTSPCGGRASASATSMKVAVTRTTAKPPMNAAFGLNRSSSPTR